MTDGQTQKIFFWFAALHLVLWTLIPTLVSPNAPLDVIEGYAWGREFLIGTHKHPPMQAWILEFFATLTGRAGFVHYLASQLAIVIAFWAVWDIGRRITQPVIALAGVVLLEAIVFYNFLSTEFNPNVLQIMFWALIAHAYYRAVTTGRLSFWVLMGVWAAGGLYSKYFTAIFLLALAIFTLAHSSARKTLLTKGPYVALAICLVLLAPHLHWLVQHDFIPLTYTQSRLAESDTASLSLLNRISNPVAFTLSQLAMLLPMIGLTWLLCGNARKPSSMSNFETSFLTYITFGPWAVTCVLSLLLGLNLKDMWGASFWNFAPLWLLTVFFGASTIILSKKFVIAWGSIATLLLIVFGIGTFAQPYMNGRIKRVHFPGKELAHIVDSMWQGHYHTPLSYVIGDTWVAGNIGFYAPSRPSLFLENNPVISPWTDLKDLHDKGAVYVSLPCLRPCAPELIAEKEQEFMDKIHSEYPTARVQEPLALRPSTAAEKAKRLVIHWALIPPASDKGDE